MKKLLLAIILIISWHLSFGQDEPADKPNAFSFIAGSFASNDGLNILAEGQFKFKKNIIHAGAAFSFTKSSASDDAFRGWIVGYKRIIMEHERSLAFIGLQYQFSGLKPIVEPLYPVTEQNHHHELILSYGYEWELGKHLWLGSSIGVGGYSETYHTSDSGVTFTLTGYSRYIDLYLRYQF